MGGVETRMDDQAAASPHSLIIVLAEGQEAYLKYANLRSLEMFSLLL